MTIRIVDSTGTVLNGVASAITAFPDKTVRVVDSTNHVIDAFSSAGATPYPTPTCGGDISSGCTQVNGFQGQLASPVPTSIPSAAGTVTIDFSQGLNRNITLNGGGAALAFSNPKAGNTYVLKLIQGSGGSFTIGSWPTSLNWRGGTTGGGGPPTLSTAAASYDLIICKYDGTYYSCDAEIGFVP